MSAGLNDSPEPIMKQSGDAFDENLSWYGVPLLYTLEALKANQKIRVQEDYWLLQAGTADEAFCKTSDVSEAATRMGKALADGHVSAYGNNYGSNVVNFMACFH